MIWFIWFALGAFTLFIFQAFNGRLKAKKIQLPWYAWIAFCVWYGLIFLGLDLVILSLYEGEARAAAILGMIFAALCLFSLPILRKMINVRQAGNRAVTKEVHAS